MRRSDREITDPAILNELIARAQVCRVAMSVANQPYIVPVSYGMLDGRLYFHSAPEGQKIDMLESNSNVCFEMEDVSSVTKKGNQPCNWSVRYASVIGFGQASFVSDPIEKRAALNAIVEHYGGAAYPYSEDAVAALCIVRIDIESMTGKANQ